MKLVVEKLKQRLRALRGHLTQPLTSVLDVRIVPLQAQGVESPDFDVSPYPSVELSKAWAEPGQTVWLRAQFQLPVGTDRPNVFLHFEMGPNTDLSGPEGLLYLDGVEYQGIDRFHRLALLPADTPVDHVFVAAVRAYAPVRVGPALLTNAQIVKAQPETSELYWTAKVAFESALEMSEDSGIRARLIAEVDAALALVDFREPGSDTFYAGMAAANARIRELLEAHPPTDEKPRITAVGHAHIDVAWLWPLEQTRWKCGRTFSTVLRLMERYPDYHFVQSQAQLYDYTRQCFPAVYDEIKRRIAEGRWEPIGGMWVESDCNVSGGEALVRQFTTGKRYFRSEFGVDSQVVWLPDAFGYTWSLPQIARGCGMKYFMTTKISWNMYNRMPHDSFRWRGVDGTDMLTHFITTPSNNTFATYNADTDAKSILGSWKVYREKTLSNEALVSFGWGDGGGGPTQEMVEELRRYSSTPGAADVRMESAGEFFERLDVVRDQLPVWEDELYLELHRGTYTTQGRTKRYNRKAECALHTAEFLAGFAAANGAAYPTEALEEAWQLTLLNQFHDILPGSSIGEVYEESNAQYEQVLATTEEISRSAEEALAARLDTQGCTQPLAVFNATGFEQTDLTRAEIDLPGEPCVAVGPNGEVSPVQVVERRGDKACVIFAAKDVPAMGAAAFDVRTGENAPAESSVTGSPNSLESPFFRLRFDVNGRLESIFDKRASREVVPPGTLANEFQAFEDLPLNWDAWEIDLFYEDKPLPGAKLESMEVVETGPVRATMELAFALGASRIRQRVSVYADVARIDFATEVDWRERHTFLKVAFPVDVHATVATHDIAFGNIQRSIRRNTSWDTARFENCAHKWIDLSEGDYGVSLLNDCKYGCDVNGNVMRLSLLRSPTSPDPEADQGRHVFTYSLFPHEGDWRHGTIPAAYALNHPLRVAPVTAEARGEDDTFSFVKANRPNIVIETVKQAFDSDETVVRICEAHNARGRATLTFDRDIAEAYASNMLEEERTPAQFDGRKLTFDYRPYEIKTFVLKFKP